MAPGETRTGQGSRAELVLIACARSKLDMPAPACQCNLSAVPEGAYLRRTTRGPLVHSVGPNTYVSWPINCLEPYERYLPSTSDSYRAAWGAWVVERLETLAGPLNGSIVEVHAGASYVDAIARHMKAKGAVPERSPPRDAHRCAALTVMTRRGSRRMSRLSRVRLAPPTTSSNSSSPQDAAITPSEFLGGPGRGPQVPWSLQLVG